MDNNINRGNIVQVINDKNHFAGQYGKVIRELHNYFEVEIGEDFKIRMFRNDELRKL